MKYLIIEHNDLEEAILFPAWAFTHADMLKKFRGVTLISAGFVRRTDDGDLYCYGESVSLKVVSRPIWDLDLILRQLSFRP